MIDGLRSRLTYSNVMATVAVFVALGGTGYAATQLPRDSVGSKQIRSKAVGRSELKPKAVSASRIRSGAVTARTLSRGTRASLRGDAGPTGPQGIQGPPGPVGPDATLRASINSGGIAVGVGDSPGATHDGGSNEYRVRFNSPIEGCTPTATLARLPNGQDIEDPPAGRITVAMDGDRVLVRTFSADGSPTSLPFNLLVAC
ncbi:MAG TPA: hypothetical protein VF533_18295 [Solirubrobacteraceae bacterium]|jgi:hypothetical protein